MNNRERFFSYGGYAASAIGCPKFTHSVDYSVFKNTPEQKGDKIAAKLKHKLLMKEKGLNSKKVLNTPEYRLETPIKITT